MSVRIAAHASSPCRFPLLTRHIVEGAVGECVAVAVVQEFV
jgi:hypothetical protein